MSLLILLILAGCFYGGIVLWKKNKILSVLSFTPLLLVFGFIGFILFSSWQDTDTQSLDFTISQKGDTYIVKGKWNEPLDYYRFATDFLIFYVPNDKPITVKRDRMKSEGGWEDFNVGVEEAIKDTYQTSMKAQVFDIQTDKTFEFSFKIPDGVKPEDIKVFYSHVRMEPMDSLEFWFKEIPLED